MSVFPYEEIDDAIAYLHQNGAVGISNILSEEECNNIIETSVVPFATNFEYTDMNDENAQEIATQHMNKYGTIGKGDLFTKELLNLRMNPKIIECFEHAYNSTDLFMTQGRVAWMRPTINNPAYRSPLNWPEVHIDLNLKLFDNDASGYFGVFNLIDNEEQDGGFHFVPESHLKLDGWRNKYIDELPDQNRYIFNSSQSRDMDSILGVCDGPIRVPCPAGTLILFDIRTVHGGAPNYSDKSRMIAYIRAFMRDSELLIPGSGNVDYNINREWKKYMRNDNVPRIFI